MSDVHTLATSLFMYHEQNNEYPCVTEYYTGPTFDYAYALIQSDEPEWTTCLGAALAPYLKEMPTDPRNMDSFIMRYRYLSYGTEPGLYLEIKLEKPTGLKKQLPTIGGFHYLFLESYHW